jgi:hypothetical protein
MNTVSITVSYLFPKSVHFPLKRCIEDQEVKQFVGVKASVPKQKRPPRDTAMVSFEGL